MTLVGLDGRTLRTQRVVPMTADQTRWLLGGRDFLHAVDQLAAIKVVAVCQWCLRADGRGDVVATPDPMHHRVFVSCAHRSGQVKTTAPLDLTQLLDALGWTLRCTDCDEKVWGDNSLTDTTLEVRCPCTIRRLVLPPTPAVGAAQVAGLGG